jgi:uncharacterized protein (TIGR03437 family)
VRKPVRKIPTLVLILAGAVALSLIGLRKGQTQTTPLRRITHTTEEGININPSISGDGKVLAFESTEDIAAASGNDHFRAIRANIATDPATFVQIGGTRAVAPAISQDGSHIAFASKDDPLGKNLDGNSEIFSFDGEELTQITTTSPGDLANRVTNGNFSPSISDDGRFIAFSSNRDLAGQNSDGNLEIFIYDALQKTFAQLTNTSGTVGSSDAKMSGNGASVAYIFDHGATPSAQRDLLEQSRVGLGPAKVLAANVQSLLMTYGRAISDDGTRIVYSAETAINITQVFLYDGRTGAGAKQITSLGTRASEVPLHPTICGDGTRIAFAARRSVPGASANSDGGVELYLFDIPSAQISRITNAPSSATAEVVSSLSDDGSVVGFNFPRVVSGSLINSDLANNSEIYLAAIPPRPAFGALTVVNGASFGKEPSTTTAIAPDSIAVATGGALANSTQHSQKLPNGTFPTNVDGIAVTVNGRAAEIFFVSPGQVNFLVPPQTEIGIADVMVTNSENFASRGSVTILQAAPGVFTKSGDGSGPGIILTSDFLEEGPFDPTNGNLRLTVFATGARAASQNSIVMGGRVVTAESVIASPDMPGLDEINLLVPRDLRGAGIVDLSIQSDGRASNLVSVTFSGDSTRDVLINEALADPPDGTSGDANHDGVRDSGDDEFIELVNTTTRDIDISGYQLRSRSSSATTDTLRHTFAAGTILPACAASVVFGGGLLNPNDPAFAGSLVVKASSGGLSLTNGGGAITLRDSAGETITSLSWGGSTGLSGDANQSVTRSPDVKGDFIVHLAAIGSGGRSFSPGTRVDGSAFAQCNPIVRINVTPPSAAIDAGRNQQFTAVAFNANAEEVSGLIFSWQTSNSAVAIIDQKGFATSLKPGSTEIRASAHGIQSAPAMLSVREIQRVLTKIEVSPASATIPAGGDQQFTARGIDQFGNELSGLTFAWESSDKSAATIDQTGLAAGVSQGLSTIRATAQNLSGTATLNVMAPTLVVNELLADPPSGADGDANHDGTRDSARDEFVELVNSTEAAIDISGWTLRTHSTSSSTETVRHTFATPATLPAGQPIVIFGGGTFNSNDPMFGCAQVVKASTGGLSLTNSGLTVLVRDASRRLITQFSYGGTTGLNGGLAQSLTRSPDIKGMFALHTSISGDRKFSSGLKVDGLPFGNCPGEPSLLTISPLSNNTSVGQAIPIQAQAFDQFGRAMVGVDISFASDNLSVATVESVSASPANGIATASVSAHNPGTAHVTASTSDGPTRSISAQAMVTVTGPTLTINDVSLNEGNSGSRIFNFTVSLSTPAPAGGVHFNIATQDATATAADSDYLPRALSGVTMAAGQSISTFEVTVNGDLRIEPNEIFMVNVTDVSGASVADGQGIGTIVNDDSPSLSINDFAASEGDGNTTTFTFNVTSTLPAPPSGITFDIGTADGTATAASGDFVARDLKHQTIPPGQTNYTFEVSVNGETLVEPNETFSVNLTNVVDAGVTDGSGQGTIQNDDTANLVISQLFGGGDNTGAPFRNDFVEIYNHGATTVDFTVTPYSIQYAGVGSNFGVNKTSLTNGTILPGRYFLVQESGGSTNGSALPAPDAIGVINLSGTAGKVTLVVGTTLLSTATCPGDDGSTPFNDSNTAIADFVGYGNTASTAGHCYEGPGPSAALSNTTAAFRKASGCFDTNDNAADFLLAAPNPRNTNSPAGDCKPEIVVNDVSITEENAGSISANFTVTLSAVSGSTVTLNYATADGTATTPADYQSTTGLLTFNPGELTRTITVLVNGDALDEPNEAFFINLSNATNGVLIDNQAQGTITDNDPAPSLSINDISVAEGNAGVSEATFTVKLSAASGKTVTVNYAAADGTAASGSDYLDTNGSLTFNPGDTSKTINVLVNGDSVFEPDETFRISLSTPTNASISDAQGVATITNDDAAQPIPKLLIDDVSILEGDSGTSIATFDVILSPAGNQVITVDFTSANGTATDTNDYQPASGSLTFHPGDTNKTIELLINGDTLVERDESFSVNLSNATGGAAIGDDQGLATIRNDDEPLIVISQIYGGGGNTSALYKNDFVEIFNRGTTTVDLAGWSVQQASANGTTWNVAALCPSGQCLLTPGRYFLVAEGSGGALGTNLPAPDASGTANLAVSGGKVSLVTNITPLTGSGCPVGAAVIDFVGYGSADCFEGSNKAGAHSNTTAGFRKSGGCLDTEDNLNDFSLAAPMPRNSTSPTNDCNTGFRPDITVNDLSIAEGDAGSKNVDLVVTLSAPNNGQPVTVNYATADGTATAGADYQSTSGTLIFNPTETSKIITVPINSDLLDEANETFFVNLSDATNAVILDHQGQATITDNDPTPSLSINDLASIPEGDSGSGLVNFTVTLSATSGQTVTVNYATADGTANAGSDYVASSGTLTFNSGELTKQIPITINGDQTFEPNETFFVNLTGALNATISDGQGQGTITNDDAAPPAQNIAIDDPSVAEGDDGTKTLDFTVSLSMANSSTVTADYATMSAAPAKGVATAGVDYVALSGTITFEPGQTSKTVSITITGDKLVEPNETFFVDLANASPGSMITDSEGTGTITNDDTPLLVISQVYGGGGNSGATYINDFIEIFNRGATTIDFALTPYSIQYAAATSAFGTNKTDITSGTLAPGHYFLIQEASGGAAGSLLPATDATGAINLAATAGKVALVVGTTPLINATCPGDDGVIPFNPNISSIADFLGYGSTANCYEGSGPATVSSTNSNARSVVRNSSCTDTNANAADFSNPASAPVARNTSSPLTSCP